MRRMDFRHPEVGIASGGLLLLGAVFLGGFVSILVSGTVEAMGVQVPISQAVGVVARPFVGSLLVTLAGAYLGLKYRNDRLEFDDQTFSRSNLFGKCVATGDLARLRIAEVTGQDLRLTGPTGAFRISKAMRGYGAFRHVLEGSGKPNGLRFPGSASFGYNRAGLIAGGALLMLLGGGVAFLIGSQASRTPDTALRGYLVAVVLGVALVALGVTVVLIGINWRLRVTPQGIEITNAVGRTLPLLPAEEIVDLKEPGPQNTGILICGIHTCLRVSSGVPEVNELCQMVTDLLRQRAKLLADEASSRD